MDFEKCTLVELRQLAKEKGVKNVSKLKKEDLITDVLKLIAPGTAIREGLENILKAKTRSTYCYW
jgi:transcription termination factor Rho